MYEVIRTISLVLAWAALAMNLYAFFRCERARKRLKGLCFMMQRLIEEWEEKHQELEVEESTDGRIY